MPRPAPAGCKALWFLAAEALWPRFLGIVMFAAISYQTLSTGVRPFYAMKRFIHPALAWSWAIGALLATMIWHLPQYALAAGMTDDIIKVTTGWEPSSATTQIVVLIVIGLVILGISTTICWGYSRGYKGVRFYERLLKGLAQSD